MKIARFVALMCLVSMLVPLVAFAGNASKRGTAGALELLLPVGARGTALAGTGSSSMTGVEAIHWNPAGLTRNWGDMSVQAIFSHMNYFADIAVDYGAVAVNTGEIGVLGLSIRSIGFGDIQETTVDYPEGTGQTFSPSYITVGLTYGKSLTDRIHVGFNAKFISESIIRTSATGFALDAGVIYYVGGTGALSGLHFGVALKNIGPNMQFDGPGLEEVVVPPGAPTSAVPLPLKYTAQSFELPSTFALGIGYDYTFTGNNRVTLMTEFQNMNFGDDQYRVAGEYSWNETFFLRGGFQFVGGGSGNADTYIFGPAFGGGVKFSLGAVGFQVDYAYQATEVFKGTNTVAVLLNF